MRKTVRCIIAACVTHQAVHRAPQRHCFWYAALRQLHCLRCKTLGGNVINPPMRDQETLRTCREKTLNKTAQPIAIPAVCAGCVAGG